MPIAKLKASKATDLMNKEEGNDSLNTFIRQAIGKVPFLSFSRAGESPVQWIQLLHALDQQDLSGWPLLTPLKVQMQKCDKCSQEFCSSINYRRHIRVHHRLKKRNKDSAKNRDLLRIFWDELSQDEAKELLSFKDVSLEGVPGSSVINSLMALIRRPGFASLPQYCLKAGSALLDIIQSRPSRFPMSSEELFSILDDASENTFLCGAAESVQKYIFDGEVGKISLETKNLIACTSFLVEQKLIKAWLADKDVEALRCHKLLVEEEEAAQRRQTELLKRKRQKKLRRKEQNAKELRLGNETDLKERINDSLEAVPSADWSCPLATSDSCMQGVESMSGQSPSTLDPIQLPSADEDVDLEIQTDSGSYSDSGNNSNVQRKMVRRNGSRHIAARLHLSPKSQWNRKQSSFHTNQNGTRRDSKSISVIKSSRTWSQKSVTDYLDDGSKIRPQSQILSQPDENKKHELLIGSISVTLGNCSHQDCDNFNGAREDCLSEHPLPKKNNSQDQHNRSDSAHYSTNHSAVKLWRPKNGDSFKDVDHIPCNGNNSSLSSNCCGTDNSFSGLQNCVLGGDAQFSRQTAKAFLAERWKEAISTEHVRLILSPDVKSSECDGIQNERRVVFSQSSDAGPFDSSVAGVGKPKFRSKSDKGVKLKYIPKPRTNTER